MALFSIAAALSLIPKIPAAWKTVAGVFGKDVPETVEQAASMVSTIQSKMQKGEVSTELETQLKLALMGHEKEIQIATMEHEKEILKAQLSEEKDKRATQVALWGNEQGSSSKYVKETRPRILRQLWYFNMFFIFISIAVVLCLVMFAARVPGVDGATVIDVAAVTLVIGFLKYIAGFLFGTFTTAFLGYTTARTMDKKNPELKEQDNMLGTVLKQLL